MIMIMITTALVITPGTHFTLLSISDHLSQSPSYLPPGVIVRTKLTLSASQSEIVGGGETREGAGQGRGGGGGGRIHCNTLPYYYY